MTMSIRERRRLAGINQAAIASKLGLSISQYSRIEANPARARQEHLSIIAHLLGCTLDELVGATQGGTQLATVRRTVQVYDQKKSEWGRGVLAAIANYSPNRDVSVGAYAIEADDESLSNNGRRSIYPGDWAVVDPAVKPAPGDIVHAVDPQTQTSMLRIYAPLHPSNPRAPGVLLKATRPSIDEVYIGAADVASAILGTVTEVSISFK